MKVEGQSILGECIHVVLIHVIMNSLEAMLEICEISIKICQISQRSLQDFYSYIKKKKKIGSHLVNV